MRNHLDQVAQSRIEQSQKDNRAQGKPALPNDRKISAADRQGDCRPDSCYQQLDKSKKGSVQSSGNFCDRTGVKGEKNSAQQGKPVAYREMNPTVQLQRKNSHSQKA